MTNGTKSIVRNHLKYGSRISVLEDFLVEGHTSNIMMVSRSWNSAMANPMLGGL